MFLLAVCVTALVLCAHPLADQRPLPATPVATGASDRAFTVQVLTRMAEPVLTALAEGRLKQRLPVHDWERDRAAYTHLEAFGRTLSGIAPWLELGPGDTAEGRVRARFITLAVQSLDRATDPRSPDYLNFRDGTQPLVDTAFLAHGLLRAPTQLWGRLSDAQRAHVVAALKASRVIKPWENNWLLFSAMVEAALWQFTGDARLEAIDHAVRKHMDWYEGDGTYGDGPTHHWDYYNSYVIQPMLVDIVRVCAEKGHPLGLLRPAVLSRARRYAAVQERLIAPDGTFPVIGRSSAYRFAAFQHLAQMALARELPAGLSAASVRSALTAVITRMANAPGTFDAQGWLQIGAVGHQPSIRESYIATGSLYLCLTGLVHLGLPPSDPFWTAPAAPWTQKRIWAGEEIAADKAMSDEKLPALPAPLADVPTARYLPIATSAWAGSSVNVVANTQQSLFTDRLTQYAAFYDADGFLVVAKRALGSDVWQTRRSAFRTDVADAHRSVSLAVDGSGRLHVAWGQHADPLNYARAVAPGAIELEGRRAMTGQRESRVTYPQFFRLPGGDLLFLYRDGEAGNGSLVLDRYSTTTGQWTQVQANLIDGEGQRSPYWGMTVDGSGTLHLAWIWRDTPDVATNHDLAYARSADGGTTWTRTDGTACPLPITAASAEYAARIAPGSNLMNSPALAADGQGRPHLVTYWSPTPGAPPQFHVVRYDGKAWKVHAGPARTSTFTLSGGGTKRPPMSRASVFVEGGLVHLVYRDDTHGGRVVFASIANLETGKWQETELTRESAGAWEPSADPVAWKRMQQIQMLLQNVTQLDGNDQTAAKVAPTPIGTLVFSPVVFRLASQPHTPAAPASAVNLDRALGRSDVLALMQRVADWQWANVPAASSRHPRGWEVAPFYVGTLALDRLAADRRYQELMVQRAETNQWEPHSRMYHADDHAVIQSYLELYRVRKDPKMLAPSRKRFDDILARPSTVSMDWDAPKSQERWTWCDALFMAPMSWLEMWEVTGERAYLDFMNREWWATTDRLFNPAAGLYFRDESYLDLREPNGRTIHWSRGNGWVFAGLSRVLGLFPKDHPDYPRYRQLYLDMARAVLAAQQPDGLWRPGLLDPVAHPERETSGSSFYTFGLAAGINQGLLDRARVEPVVRRAWNALADCVTPEGRLEHVQPIGAGPHGFDPKSTDTFAVGAFLLAGSEVYRLARHLPGPEA
jgi:rhamnogalacturonyl hydrolase YesR